LAFSRRQSQNCGPSGGGIAAFGDGGADIGGTTQVDDIHVGDDATIDGDAVITGTTTLTGVATFTAAPVIPAGATVGGVIPLKVTRSWRGVAAAAEVNTAGAGTYSAANLLTGTIVRDCTGASRTDTLDTAANLVAALAAAFGVAAAVGDCLDCLIVNGSDPVTEIITLDAGTGGGYATEQRAVSRTILGTTSRLIRIRFTNVTTSSEAYVVYI